MGNAALHDLYRYGPDDGRCFGLDPDAEIVYTGWLLRMPAVEHSVNSQGYRGPSHPFEKPPGTLRILLVGDSYTFGAGLPEDDTISAQLEDLLGTSSSRPVEVLNFGIPGMNLEETLEQYERFASQWEHDVVLYLLFANDLDGPQCEEESINRREAAILLRNVYLARVIIMPIVLASGFLSGEGEVNRLTSVVGQYDASSKRNRAEFRVVVLANPVAGERKDERFEAWMQQTAVHLLDLSHLWSDLGNLIPREYHFNKTGSRRAAIAIAEWLHQPSGLMSAVPVDGNSNFFEGSDASTRGDETIHRLTAIRGPRRVAAGSATRLATGETPPLN